MKIGYSKTFPVIGKDQWEKNWLEDEVNLNLDYLNLTDADIDKAMANVKRVQYALKRQVESFFYESKAAAEKQAIQEQTVTLDEDGKTIADIMLAKDLVELKTFELQVSRSKAIKLAYNNRLKQLQSNGL